MLRTLALFLAVLAAGGNAVAGTIYGVSSDSPGVVYTINASTGAATPVVSITGASDTSFVGAEFLGGTLYISDALTTQFSFGSVDLSTGAFNEINDQGGSANWHGLAANPGLGLLYSVDQDNSDSLVTVTPGGVISIIGPTGQFIVGLAYDSVGGILYGSGPSDLYTIDTATGVASLVGSLGIAEPANGLAFDPDSLTLFLNGGNSLYSVNTGTGAATLIGPNSALAGLNIDGLAVLADETQVPEPATIGFLGTGLVFLAALRRRR
jgi:hypothetical protein